jgi:hypothetical protein
LNCLTMSKTLTDSAPFGRNEVVSFF